MTEIRVYYLVSKTEKFIEQSDNACLNLTGEGAEYLEQSYRSNLQNKRLQAAFAGGG